MSSQCIGLSDIDRIRVTPLTGLEFIALDHTHDFHTNPVSFISMKPATPIHHCTTQSNLFGNGGRSCLVFAPYILKSSADRAPNGRE